MENLFGLIGEKLIHSKSPEIHSYIYKYLNMSGKYKIIPIKKEELKQDVNSLSLLGYKGLNVTIPYKVKVMDYLDEISLEARNIGAINTIQFKDNKLYGYNTDYYGFGGILKKFNVNIKGEKAVILGTGGASRAVVQYLLDNGIKDIVLVSRDKSKVNYIINNKNMKVINYNELDNIKDNSILVNSTPCGMYPNMDNSPLDKRLIKNFSVVIDLIYNPKETKLLKYAKQCDIKSINGMYMLIAQAVKSEEIWNNIKISDNIIDKIYNVFK